MREPKDINILIVDDEPALRGAIEFDFKRKGYSVWSAGDGREAFEVVKNKIIDVVLTDVRMPNGDGVELLENIKAYNPKLPVVMFITGFADISVEEAYDKGVNAVFSKPFDRKALFAAVTRVVTDLDDQLAERKIARIDVESVIDLSFKSLNFSGEGQLLNLGRGGMFIALTKAFPKLGAKVSFNIKVQDPLIANIEGVGIVRWVRTQTENNVPAGCGIEFEQLSDRSRKDVVSLLNDLKTKSFIPRS